METALDELLICVFTISDDRLSDAIQRAHRNGLTVRVLSDNDKMDDRGNDIERLAASGVDVRNEEMLGARMLFRQGVPIGLHGFAMASPRR